MPEVSVDIAGRSYRIGCGEGEEDHLVRLAGMLDAEARKLQRQFTNMAEPRLLLMTALIMADRVVEAENALGEIESQVAEAEKLADSRDGSEREKELTRRLNAIARQIEEAGAVAGRS